MVIRTDDEIYLRGQTGAELDGSRMLGLGRTPEDAAAQADQAMANIKTLLEETGAGLDDICKITIYIVDRAYREAVYQVVGHALQGVFPVETGLIVDGLVPTGRAVALHRNHAGVNPRRH